MAMPRSTLRGAALAALLLAPSASFGEAAQPSPVASAEPPAQAPPPAPEDPSKAWETARATRRSGFVIGIALQGGFGALSGYPADTKKIGVDAYYSTTGIAPAIGGFAWIGGALTDWFVFGVGGGTGRVFVRDREAFAFNILFHIEAFPLFPLGGALRDLGVMLNVGTGQVTLHVTGRERAIVDSGVSSVLGGGVFWEGIRLWRVAMGPFVLGNYQWSSAADWPALFVGWRTSLYTGP
jgi:hypothetical protein